MYLGPAIPVACKSCGKNIGVPFLSVLALAPFIASIFIATELDSAVMQAGVIVLGFLVFLMLHIKIVPLEAR